MIYLYVTPSGSVNLIEGEEMPIHIYSDSPKETESKMFQDALRRAKASSVPVAPDDQNYVRAIITGSMGDRGETWDGPTPEKVYGPFDFGVQWDWINPCIPEKKCLKEVHGRPCPKDCKSIYRVAIIKDNSEPVGKLEEKEESPEEREAREWELWRDFLYIVGSKRYLLHGEDFMGTNWEDLMGILKSEGFTITRKQSTSLPG